MPSASETSAIAAHWLIRLEGEASPELWEEFQGWLYADTRHRAAFIRLRTGWNRCDKLKMLRPDNGTIDADLLGKIEIVTDDEPATAVTEPVPVPSAQGTTRGARRFVDLSRRQWLAAAAVATVAILAAGYGTLRGHAGTYTTEIGERQEIHLSDGSTVELNTDSELKVRLSGERRDLVLRRGEALFHVAHDTGRPFYVIAGGTVVRAVGTAFSVRIRDENCVDVLVKEGRVAVGTPEGADRPVLNANAAAVSAGEGAVVRRGRVAVTRMQTADMARKLSWTVGRLYFQGETLNEAVSEFNRYNRRHLLLTDPSIMQMTVGGGNFRTTDLDSFVAALERSLGVRAVTTTGGSSIELAAAPADPAQSRASQKEVPPTP